MNIRYHVELSEAERCELTALVGSGKHYARKIKRAQILLAADSGLSDDDIAAAVAVGGSTVYRTKRRFVEGNLEAALSEEPRAGADRKLTSNEEALLIATACSSPPEGRARWTLELLAGAMVKLTDHDSLSRETVRRRLAENHLKPWQKGDLKEQVRAILADLRGLFPELFLHLFELHPQPLAAVESAPGLREQVIVRRHLFEPVVIELALDHLNKGVAGHGVELDALVEQDVDLGAFGYVVHPQGRRRVRRPHGGCARPLCRAA